MRVIGIDPGNSGALVILPNKAEDLMVFLDMPVIELRRGGGKVPDVSEIIKFIDDTGVGGDDIVFLEKPAKRPTFFGGKVVSSVQANYLAGYYAAMFCTLFRLKGIRYQEVTPQAWQKVFSISSKSGDTGEQSYLIASKLYPKAELTGKRGGKKDGRSDALLIATYGKRTMGN